VKFPCKLCKEDHLTHLCPKIEEASRLIAQHPVVLTNPFPHNQNMTSGASNTRNASSGSQNPSAHDGGHQCINMVRSEISVATRTHDYGSSQPVLGPEPPPPETPLQIDKPEPLPHILKGVLKCSAHNPNARATQNYSIVEDLGQTPCAMSSLEVLQTCPTQRNALLSAFGSSRPEWLKIIKFDVTDVKPHLPYHVAFQIHVEGMNITIKHTVIDEGASHPCNVSILLEIHWLSTTFSIYDHVNCIRWTFF
jgi:hypothetical protein